MKDDIVIVSAARTPVGAFNGAFANLPAHELGKAAIKAALDRAGVEGPRQRSDHGTNTYGRPGTKPGAAGFDCSGHPRGNACVGCKPALRVGSSFGRARLPGNPQWR